MLFRTTILTGISTGLALALGGCNAGFPWPQQPTGLAADVAGKAQEVARQIGGTNGFGGAYMNGYSGHMGPYMGFYNASYLADPNDDFVVELTNQSQFPCVFHLAYIQSELGLDQQIEIVTVDAGESVDVSLPCAEIVGIGSLTDVGAIGAEFPNGTNVDNRFCVPGFLNSDYVCGGAYACVLTPDTDDLDQDGDTEELVIVSTGMLTHMQQGGMASHMGNSGFGPGGMMGGWWSMMAPGDNR